MGAGGVNEGMMRGREPTTIESMREDEMNRGTMNERYRINTSKEKYEKTMKDFLKDSIQTKQAIPIVRTFKTRN